MSLLGDFPPLRGTKRLQVVSEDSLEEAAFLGVTSQRLTSIPSVSWWHLQGWVGLFPSPLRGAGGCSPPLLEHPQ